jgi:hypothetical protein
MNDVDDPKRSSNMTNIAYFKYVLFGLLLISTTTVIFYVSSISQMETDQGENNII